MENGNGDRYQCGELNHIAARAVTDEIMYQIMVLSGLSYVDEYIGDVKAKKQGQHPAPAGAGGDSGSAPTAERQPGHPRFARFTALIRHGSARDRG